MSASTTTYYLKNMMQNNFAGVPQSFVSNGAYIQGLSYSVNDPTEMFVLTQRGPDKYTISMGTYTVVPEADPMRDHSNVVLNDSDQLRQFTWRIKAKAKDKYPNTYGISTILNDHEFYWTLRHDRSGCNIILTTVLVDELVECQYWVFEVAKFTYQPDES